MKVIFLDVDGVLNNSSWAKEKLKNENVHIFTENLLYEPSLFMLKDIVDETGAVIVLSSAWRKFKSARTDLVKQLDKHGLTIYSDTPDLGGVRGNDIKAWLDMNPGVESYVIIDDEADMLETQLPYLVQTTFEDGLQDCHYRRAKAILNHTCFNGFSLFNQLLNTLPHYEEFYDGQNVPFYQNGEEILTRNSNYAHALANLLDELEGVCAVTGFYDYSPIDSLDGFYYILID